jgi:excisionase family DNA binding protein
MSFFDEYLDVKEASQRLKCHPETIKRQIRSDNLLATKIGPKWFIKRMNFERFASAYTPQVGRPSKHRRKQLRLL